MNTNNKLDYICQGNVTKEKIKELQRRLLLMAKKAKDVFEKNDIPYYIMFGTLLGAVRHKGFIPWDIDFDMLIPEDVYSKAINCLESEIEDWMIIQSADNDSHYCSYWSRLADRNSTVMGTVYLNDNLFQYKGVHVDLYVAKKCNHVNLEYNRTREAIEFFERKKRKNLIDDDEYQKKINELNKKLKLCNYEREEVDDCYYLLANDWAIAPLQQRARYTFEDTDFWGPQNNDWVLNKAYGKNYMEIPPYEKRDPRTDNIVLL